MIKVQTEATLTCPHCGAKHEESMPTDSCRFFYKCKKCGKIIKAKEKECCVFCSYADIRCQSKQVQIINDE